VIQPWVNRMGVTETLRAAREAARRGRQCLLAGWNATPVGVAASVHVAAGLPGPLAFEHAPDELYDFELRQIGTSPFDMVDGAARLPTRPGLGVEIDWERVAYLDRGERVAGAH
jgi:L-alanine-DL-glutamate epimerase-like enolase superfamily enzyme